MPALVRYHTGSNSKTSGNTITVTLAADVAPGNLIVVGMSADNLTATTPTITGVSKPGGESATWTIPTGAGGTSTAAAAQRTQGAYIFTTTTWASGTVITITLSGSVTARAAIGGEWSGVGAYIGNVTSSNNTGGAPSVTITAASTRVNGLLVGIAGFENSGAMTPDSDTTSGAWDSGAGDATTGGSGATNISVGMQHKITTAAVGQTYNPTGGNDSSALIMSFDAGVTQHPFTGTVPVTSAVSGTMGLRPALAGTVAASSTVSGTMELATASDCEWSDTWSDTWCAPTSTLHEFSGTVSAASAVSGTMGLRAAMSGTVAAASAVTGSMVRTASLAGAVTAVSAATGAMGARLALASTAPVVSTVAGAMGLRAALAGIAAAASGVSGTMAQRHVLAGQVDAISAAAGTMNVGMRGTVVATSAVTGTMGMRAALAGTVIAISGTSGQFGGHPFIGNVVAVSTVTGTMGVRKPLAGTVAAVSGAAGTMQQQHALSGTVAAVSASAGMMLQRHALVGEVVVLSAASGTLGAAIALEGVVVAVASSAGAMDQRHALEGQVDALSDVIGSMFIGEPPEFIIIDVDADGFAVLARQDPFAVETSLDGFRVRGSAP